MKTHRILLMLPILVMIAGCRSTSRPQPDPPSELKSDKIAHKGPPTPKPVVENRRNPSADSSPPPTAPAPAPAEWTTTSQRVVDEGGNSDLETVEARMAIRPGTEIIPVAAGPRVNRGVGYELVEVFFATDRKKTDTAGAKSYYGAERGELTYGVTRVSIPRVHKMGGLEAPSILRIEFSEDPKKHVMLLNVASLDQNYYFERLNKKLKLSNTSKAFIYIHGYNTTFEDAARRTAQISYDLEFNGVPLFYSWPSQGSTPKYPVDEANVEWTKTHLKKFLTKILSQSEAEEIYLIAHSMGNRALTKAYIDTIKANPYFRKKIKEIVLAAPDIDAGIFKRDIAPALAKAGAPVTLYASSEDIALKASKAVHGHPRAGDAGTSLVIVPGIETIDATSVKTTFLGHSYYANDRSILSDMFYIIHKSLRAKERSGLDQKNAGNGTYWAIKN